MRRSNRRRQQLPVDPVRLTIDRVGHDGRGIASNEGKVAFVEGALPGETVDAVFINRRGKYDELRVQQIIEPVAQRAVPPCEFAAVCGGCVLQHMQADAQLQLKQQILLEHLRHSPAALTEFECLPAMSADNLAYRRKARLAVRYVHKKNDVLVGFREKANSFIADMESCAVLVRPVGSLIRPLRDLLMSMDGKRDIPQIEVAVGEQKCVDDDELDKVLSVSLILRHLEALSETDLNRLRDFGQLHNIHWYLQSGGPATVKKFWPPDENKELNYFLPDPLGDIEMRFRPDDFTQVNAKINRRMIRQALELLDLTELDRVLDLFCGLGNFTLPMARRCAQVTGVEGSDSMLQRAADNASRNNIDNVQFHVADLFTEFDTQSWANGGYNKLLLDPPRSGAIEIVSRINELAPDVIVYVSCNPATLARDAAQLVMSGYRMTHAGVMDMFPHTGHVESMARFERVSEGR
ncbi:23S rRNA (uracil(1939)-C(5))-methyltransferase RlmD [Pseudohongiella spirulinae]|uniref:23S rRNA (uracil(1939)-C(5))-methyltransferase RlmD n=1 Tax=Pseudohongiella spirulinae TaxID=1249552 RepID=A0A0S2KDT2_9GAMM|nr:23S rRNA (uracil(1939)-C(5))-methyltransferase RlmD [Pseudohongiella spirulinae]ALO46244.1 23S rRNA methyltransferase [Pseudohongiella spirulinae]